MPTKRLATNILASGNLQTGTQFLAANGTAALPSYAFTNDTGSGIYLGAAGNVASGASMFGNAAGLLGGFGTASSYGASALFSGNGLGALSGGWGMLTGGGPASIMAQGAGMMAGVLGPLLIGVGGLVALINKTKGETRVGGQFGVAFSGEVDNNRRGQTYTYEGQQYDRDFSNGERNPLVDGQAYRLAAQPPPSGEVRILWSDGPHSLTWSPGVRLMWMSGSTHLMCGRSSHHH